jgi:short subunit dehydrogenase-like uncharacterized protein
VLFGATGFTGRLTAERLAARCVEEDLPWAVAGRSEEKLLDLRNRLVSRHPDAQIHTVVADVQDPGSLLQMAKGARAVATTVGPYAEHGEPVAQACLGGGAHYCDLTGEPAFWKGLIARHHADAERKGVLLVPACGFDSIPADLGTFFLLDRLDPQPGEPVRVEAFVKGKGKFSGGTWHSLLGAVADSGSMGGGPKTGRGRITTRMVPRFDASMQRWVVPMPVLDPLVVRRSALKTTDGQPRYGDDFGYGQYLQVGSAAQAVLLALGGAAVIALAQLGPARELLGKVKPRGEGPTDEEIASGFFQVTVRGSAGQRHATATVTGGDPGYGETSKMLAEAALCLAQDGDRLPHRGGVLTPASALGQPFLDRLQAQGIRFEMTPDDLR